MSFQTTPQLLHTITMITQLRNNIQSLKELEYLIAFENSKRRRREIEIWAYDFLQLLMLSENTQVFLMRHACIYLTRFIILR